MAYRFKEIFRRAAEGGTDVKAECDAEHGRYTAKPTPMTSGKLPAGPKAFVARAGR